MLLRNQTGPPAQMQYADAPEHELTGETARALLADYLNRVSVEIGSLPAERQDDLRREIAQHLHALAAAHEELGSTPEKAALAAQRQFGDPRRVGRTFARQWRRAPQNASFRHDYGRALAAFGGLASFNFVLMTLLNQNRVPVPNVASWLWHTFLVGWCILGTPVVAGWRLGNRAPGPNRTGGAAALALVCALATICAVLGSAGLLLFPLARLDTSSLSESACKNFLWIAVFGVAWMPLGMASLAAARVFVRRRLRPAR